MWYAQSRYIRLVNILIQQPIHYCLNQDQVFLQDR